MGLNGVDPFPYPPNYTADAGRTLYAKRLCFESGQSDNTMGTHTANSNWGAPAAPTTNVSGVGRLK